MLTIWLRVLFDQRIVTDGQICDIVVFLSDPSWRTFALFWRLRRSATITDYKRAAIYATCSCSISAQSAMVRPGTLYIAAAIVAVLITRGRTCVTSTLLPILFHRCQNSTQVVCNLWLILEDGIISREARLSAWVIVPQAKNRFKLPEVRGPHLSPAQTGYFFWCDFGK